MAPKLIEHLKSIFTKPKKQKNPIINEININLQEDLKRVNSIRSVAGSQPLSLLDLKLNNKIPVKVKFIHDLSSVNNSEAEMAMGLSDVELNYWFKIISDNEKLTNCFDDTNSYIYKNQYLNNILSRVYNFYIDKRAGQYKLQSTVFKKLKGAEAFNFFVSAIFGEHGTVKQEEGGKDNINFFYNGEMSYKLTSPFYGTAVISFSGELRTKDYYIKLFNEERTCLVIEQNKIANTIVNRKIIPNISVGIYTKEYLNQLKDSIELSGN